MQLRKFILETKGYKYTMYCLFLLHCFYIQIYIIFIHNYNFVSDCELYNNFPNENNYKYLVINVFNYL